MIGKARTCRVNRVLATLSYGDETGRLYARAASRPLLSVEPGRGARLPPRQPLRRINIPSG